MGYYTYYTLNMWDEEGNELKSAVKEEVRRELIKSFDDMDSEAIAYAEDVVNSLCSYGTEMEWYNSDEDMVNLAKKFPYVKFELEGRGEDTGDWWVAQYWGDKSELEIAQRPTPHLF